MAASQQREPLPESERQAMEIAFLTFKEEAMREPLKYIKHNVKSHDDDALYRLVVAHGMEYYGWYWLLVELLGNRTESCHSYDVSDEIGWNRLAHDMSCMCPMSVDKCKEFVEELSTFGLISNDHFREQKLVTITRLRRHAEEVAESIAQKKLGAWKTNRKRMFS